MSEFGALQNCLAVMELANIELKQQNAELVEALDHLQCNLSKAWPHGDRSGFEQALLDTIDQALAKVGK